MLGGYTTKWQKLCNAVKILQTISKNTAEQKARFAAIVAANNLMTGNDDNFQLEYSENPNSTILSGMGRHAIYVGVSKLVVDELKRLKDKCCFISQSSRY